jgi:YD repeat-containing protein
VFGHLIDQAGPGSTPHRTWIYNGKGWLDHQTLPESGTTSYLYDNVGNVTRMTDANGHVTVLTYDAENKLLSRDADGTEADATFTYDAIGRLATQQSPSVTTTLTYETAGRLATKSDRWWGGRNWQSTYSYDGNDNLTQLTYPSGRIVGYSYDIEDRLTSVTQNGSTFANGFAYDDSGRLASYVTGAVTHAVSYDTRDRVAHMTSGVTGGTPALDLTYHYNSLSQITAIDDPRTSMSQTFGYDTLERLTSANGPYGALSWAYDGTGNRVSDVRAGASTSYAYDHATLRLTSTSGASNETFTYDAVGQLTSDRYGTYSYLATGVLRHVAGPAGSNLSANYYTDVAGQRTIRSVSDQNTYPIDTPSGGRGDTCSRST